MSPPVSDLDKRISELTPERFVGFKLNPVTVTVSYSGDADVFARTVYAPVAVRIKSFPSIFLMLVSIFAIYGTLFTDTLVLFAAALYTVTFVISVGTSSSSVIVVVVVPSAVFLFFLAIRVRYCLSPVWNTTN